MNKDLEHREICHCISRAQEIIVYLIKQHNVEISEEYHLKKAYAELLEVYGTQLDKLCKLGLKELEEKGND